jgi:hypothetical protein
LLHCQELAGLPRSLLPCQLVDGMPTRSLSCQQLGGLPIHVFNILPSILFTDLPVAMQAPAELAVLPASRLFPCLEARSHANSCREATCIATRSLATKQHAAQFSSLFYCAQFVYIPAAGWNAKELACLRSSYQTCQQIAEMPICSLPSQKLAILPRRFQTCHQLALFTRSVDFEAHCCPTSRSAAA